MRISRRQFIATATCALAPARLWSATVIDLGAGRHVLSLSDGHLELPAAFVFGDMPDAERQAILAAHGLATDGPLMSPCNVTLLRDGTNTVLFDTGAGAEFQASAGQLTEALAIAGVAHDEVTHVLFTHAHPDHLWGAFDDFGDLTFPNARHMIGGAEAEYWTDPTTLDTIGEARLAFAVGAARRLGDLSGQIDLIEAGDTPIPGITARATYGHTPGHLSFDLGDLLVIGDCIGNAHVSFDQPAARLGSDQNAEMGAETRLRLMPELAATAQPILGFHFPDGGIGTVEADSDQYRFKPL